MFCSLFLKTKVNHLLSFSLWFSKIREELQKQDFNLQDKFCDTQDLEEAWKSIAIPPEEDEFLCALLVLDESKIDKLSPITVESRQT